MRKAVLLSILCSVILSGCWNYVSAENTAIIETKSAAVTETSPDTIIEEEASSVTTAQAEDKTTETGSYVTASTKDTTSTSVAAADMDRTSTSDTNTTAAFDKNKAPKAADITKTASEWGRVRLYWEKAECSGYLVYYLKDDTWTEIGSFNDPNTTQCLVRGLTNGTSYKFRIQTYNINDEGERVPGAFSEEVSAKPVKKYDGYVIIGDSRAVQMSEAADVQNSGVNVEFIARSCMGYSWFSATALDRLEEYLQGDSSKHYKIVIAMGVNDVVNVDEYIACYKELIEKYPEHRLYFVSVNPIVDGLGYSCTNETIDRFNSRLKEAFPDSYIDTAGELKENGFDTPDGLHYSESTNARIFYMIIENTK